MLTVGLEGQSTCPAAQAQCSIPSTTNKPKIKLSYYIVDSWGTQYFNMEHVHRHQKYHGVSEALDYKCFKAAFSIGIVTQKRL
jgi:hypothetical protein